MKRNILLLTLLLLLAHVGQAQWLAGYASRKKITIDHNQVSGTADLTNFVMLFSSTDADLADTANGGQVWNSNGYDIVFTASDGTTLLNHEMEDYDNTTGTYVGWVQIPTLDHDDNTEIYVYFGKNTAADPSTTATWESDYEAVWHLNGNGNDATTNTRNGTNNGATAVTESSSPASLIAGGYDFEENDGDNIQVASFDIEDASSNPVDQITMSAWIRPESFDINDARILSKADGVFEADHDWMLSTNTTRRLRMRLLTGGGSTVQSADNALSADTWQYVVGTYDGSNMYIYVNGTQVGSGAKTGNVANNNKVVKIADNDNDNKYFDGVMDEVRVQSTYRNGDWITTEYNNQINADNFYSIGVVECNGLAGGDANAEENSVSTGDNATIILTGHTTASTTIEWQKSIDGGSTYAALTGESDDTLLYLNQTYNSIYRVKLTQTSTGCSVYSDTAGVEVTFDGYAYKKLITIDHTEVCGATDLSDFPVMVRTSDADLKHTTEGGHVTSMAGYDIVFTANDGTTKLDHDLEYYDPTTGQLVAWVLVPTVSASANTTFYMHYGNGKVAVDQSSTDTWDNNYVGVWHLTDHKDGTENEINGIEFDVTRTDGLMGGAFDFEENLDSRMELGVFNVNGGTEITLSGWFKPESYDKDDGRIISKAVGHDNEDHYFMLSTVDNSGMKPRFRLKTDDGGAWDGTTTFIAGTSDLPDVLTNNEWVYCVATYDGTNMTLYEYSNQGIHVNSTAKTGNIVTSDVAKVDISNQPGNAMDPRKPMDGLLDEVRVQETCRSQDWICTEYANQKPASTFLSIGPEIACTPAPTPGVALVTDERLYNGEETTVRLTSYTGSKTWQYSYDNISYYNLTDTTQMINTGPLTMDIYYRAIVENNGCQRISEIDTVEVTTKFLTGYSYRKKITIDHDKVFGDNPIIDFPILISMEHYDLSDDAGKVQHAQGWDITFTENDGVTQLTYDKEYFDGSEGGNTSLGKIVAWVKIPSLDPDFDTEIYMYYGNCDGGLSDPSNTNTWSNDYEGVWHLNTDADDATANLNDGVNSGAAANTGGLAAGCYDFEHGDGTDKITLPDVDPSTEEMTVSLWVKPESFTEQEAMILSKGTDHQDQNQNFAISTTHQDINGDTDAKSDYFMKSFDGGSNTTEELPAYPSTLAAGTWMYIVGTYDANDGTGKMMIYEDGLFIEEDNNPSGDIISGATSITLGNTAGGTALPFDGLIDEVRISSMARDEHWIRTEHANQSDPAGFITVGAEEKEVAWTGNTDTDWGTASNWSICAVPGPGDNILIPTGRPNYPILDIDRTIGYIVIENGGDVDLNSLTLTVEGDFKNDGSFTANGGTVVMDGTTDQYIKYGNATTFYNLTIDNTSEIIYLGNDIAIDNELTLTQGSIYLRDQSLIINDAASIVNADASNYIVTDLTGSLKQTDIGLGGKTGDVLFPVGCMAGSYTPVTITNAGTADTFMVRVSEGIWENGQVPGDVRITEDVVDRTWFIDEGTDGGSDVDLTIQWNAGEELLNFDRTNSLISHHTGTDWARQVQPGTALGAGPYYLTATNLSSFSPHGVGDKESPLPIELVALKGRLAGQRAQLTWQTASEYNASHFEVEKSIDGRKFEYLARVAATGYSSQLQDYSTIDESPYEGITYYRLKMVDNDGYYEYSNIVAIETGDTAERGLTIYPNPAPNGEFCIYTRNFKPYEKVLFKMVSQEGQVLIVQEMSLNAWACQHMNMDLPAGVYYLLMTTEEGKTYEEKLVIF